MKNIRLRQRRAHQDDNFAKLRYELLSVRKLIAKILVAVSRIKIKRIKEMPAKLRAFRKYAHNCPLAPTAHPPSRQSREIATGVFIHV